MSDPRFWIQTYTKRAFRYDDTANLDIGIKDIARPLSRLPRFLGHSISPITVAEHSLISVLIMRELKPAATPLLLLHTLLHDAHEAFYGDIPTPLKRYLLIDWGLDINYIMAQAQFNIMGALNVPPLSDLEERDLIGHVDKCCVIVERVLFMDSNLEWDIDSAEVQVKPHWKFFYKRMTASEAYQLFVQQYNELMEEINTHAHG